MNIIKHWVAPLIISVILVLIFRHFWFNFIIVPDDLMNNTLKKGNLVLIQKKTKIKQNNIVLFDTIQSTYISSARLSRCVALPGDTLQIFNSVIFINGKKLDQKPTQKRKTLAHYIFHSDSNNIEKLLNDNKIDFNKQLAEYGIYSFYTDKNKLINITRPNIWRKKQRIMINKSLNSEKTAPFIRRFYWNKDNFGPIIVPSLGMAIKLGRINFELYKHIIIKETTKNLLIKGNIVFLDNKKIGTYTFKSDYYFVLNDNRLNTDDSRSFGFIKKDYIIGKFVFKLN